MVDTAAVIPEISAETITTELTASITSDAVYSIAVDVDVSASVAVETSFYMNFEEDILVESYSEVEAAITTVLTASTCECIDYCSAVSSALAVEYYTR